MKMHWDAHSENVMRRKKPGFLTIFIFPERLGGRVQLRRGVHLREARPDAAQGGQGPHGAGADAIRGLQLHGGLVLREEESL